MDRAWLYKGNDSKIFEGKEIEAAMQDGWVDHPAKAKEAETKSKNKTKEQEEAEFQAELKKEEEEKLAKEKSGASSGTTTFKE